MTLEDNDIESEEEDRLVNKRVKREGREVRTIFLSFLVWVKIKIKSPICRYSHISFKVP